MVWSRHAVHAQFEQPPCLLERVDVQFNALAAVAEACDREIQWPFGPLEWRGRYLAALSAWEHCQIASMVDGACCHGGGQGNTSPHLHPRAQGPATEVTGEARKGRDLADACLPWCSVSGANLRAACAAQGILRLAYRRRLQTGPANTQHIY